MSEPKIPNPGRRLAQLFDLLADKAVKSDPSVDPAQSAANIKAARQAEHDSRVDIMLNETFGIIDEVQAQAHPHP